MPRTATGTWPPCSGTCGAPGRSAARKQSPVPAPVPLLPEWTRHSNLPLPDSPGRFHRNRLPRRETDRVRTPRPNRTSPSGRNPDRRLLLNRAPDLNRIPLPGPSRHSSTPGASRIPFPGHRRQSRTSGPSWIPLSGRRHHNRTPGLNQILRPGGTAHPLRTPVRADIPRAPRLRLLPSRRPLRLLPRIPLPLPAGTQGPPGMTHPAAHRARQRAPHPCSRHRETRHQQPSPEGRAGDRAGGRPRPRGEEFPSSSPSSVCCW